MDQFRKRRPSDRVPGGLSRIMVLRRVGSMFHAGNWFPAADVYETASAIIVCMDISGIEPHSLAVMVEESQVTVSGERGYAPQDMVSCIHQLGRACKAHFAGATALTCRLVRIFFCFYAGFFKDREALKSSF